MKLGERLWNLDLSVSKRLPIWLIQLVVAIFFAALVWIASVLVGAFVMGGWEYMWTLWTRGWLVFLVFIMWLIIRS